MSDDVMLKLAERAEACADCRSSAYPSEVLRECASALRAAAASAEPVAWQSRFYIGGHWTQWRELDGDLGEYKKSFAFNLENGTLEFRPLYTHPAPDAEIASLRAQVDALNGDLHQLGQERDDLKAQLASARKALEFYRDEAEAIQRNMRLGKSADAVLASLTVLSLDAGNRAKTALTVE